MITGTDRSAPTPAPVVPRRPLLGVVGVAILLLGGIALAVSILVLVRRGGDVDDDIVHEMRVGLGVPAVAVLDLEPGDYTVYSRFDGVRNEGLDQEDLDRTSCRITFDAATTADFRGNVQGISDNVGAYSSIGTFDAPGGPTTVTCQRDYGRRLADQRTIVVARGAVGLGSFLPIAAVVASSLIVLAGFALAERGFTGRKFFRSDSD
jgi:hypothetical protein